MEAGENGIMVEGRGEGGLRSPFQWIHTYTLGSRHENVDCGYSILLHKAGQMKSRCQSITLSNRTALV